MGSLDVGKVADVTVFDGTTRTAYRAVIAASVEDVHLVLRGGKAMYGDADLVAALDGTCTAFDVYGVPDTSDDCPTIFNPPRPLDNGDAAPLVKQADVDGDGVGDACDAKPLDPATH
jgi:hypothetical protein